MKAFMHIGELAERAGVSARALRHYEKLGWRRPRWGARTVCRVSYERRPHGQGQIECERDDP